MDGSSTIVATGFLSAIANAALTATVTATAVNGVSGEVAVAAPLINNTARSHLSGSATVNAGGAVNFQATTNTTVNTLATGNLGIGITGTTTATPVVTTITDAFIDAPPA